MKTRKCIISLLLIAAIMLPLAGCGAKNDSAAENYSYLKDLKEEYVLSTNPFEYEQLIPPYTFSASRGGSWLEQYLGSLGITERNEMKNLTAKTETLTYNADNAVIAVSQRETKVYTYVDKRLLSTEIHITTDFDPSVYSNPERITFEFKGNTSDGIAAATRFIENFSDVRLAADFSNNYSISKTYYITDTSYYTLTGSVSDSTNIDSSIVKVSIGYKGDASTRVYKADKDYSGNVVTGDVALITGSYEPVPGSSMKLFGKMSKAQLLNHLRDQGVEASSITVTSHFIHTGDAMSMQNIFSFNQDATTNFLTITEAYSYNPDPLSVGKEINETFNVYFKQKPTLPEQRDLISLLFGITESEAAKIVEQGTGKVTISSTTAGAILPPSPSSNKSEANAEASGGETSAGTEDSDENTTENEDSTSAPSAAAADGDEFQAIFDTIRMCFEIIRPGEQAQTSASPEESQAEESSKAAE